VGGWRSRDADRGNVKQSERTEGQIPRRERLIGWIGARDNGRGLFNWERAAEAGHPPPWKQGRHVDGLAKYLPREARAKNGGPCPGAPAGPKCSVARPREPSPSRGSVVSPAPDPRHQDTRDPHLFRVPAEGGRVGPDRAWKPSRVERGAEARPGRLSAVAGRTLNTDGHLPRRDGSRR
jgi:hypothetical protein